MAPIDIVLGRLPLLALAALRLAQVAVSMRFRGFLPTHRWLAVRAHRAHREGRITHPNARANALRWAVDRAARLSPRRPACLTRSLALWSLLGHQGIDCSLRFGARPGPDGLLAHAWVELNGVVLNDTPDVVQRFPPLSGSDQLS